MSVGSLAVRRKLGKILVITLGVVLAAVAMMVVAQLLAGPHRGWTDFRSIFNGVEALAGQQNPYVGTGYFYPLWLAIALLPLTSVGYELAAEIWFWLNLAMLVAAVLLVTRQWPLPRRGLFLLTAIAFAPSLNTLVHGQLSIIVLFGAALPLLGRLSIGWLAALSLTLLTVKPHLGLTIALAALWLWFCQKQFRLTSASIGLVAVALILPLAKLPLWPLEWLSASVTGEHFVSASPAIGMILSKYLSSPLAWAIHWVFGLLALAWAIRWTLVRRPGPQPLLAVACLISLLLSPYYHSYDLVLLLPALACVAERAIRREVGMATVAIAAFVYAIPYAPFFSGDFAVPALVVAPITLLGLFVGMDLAHSPSPKAV